MLTLFAAVVLIVCGILLIAIVGMFIAYARGQVDELGSAGVAILGGFGLAVLAVAYWSGSWLFRGDDAPVSQRAAESTGRSVELADDYPGAWQSDAPGNIIRALAVNDVRGCGEFHHKASVRNSGEYLVYCTRDGRTWTSYLVWPNVDRISGPARPDPKISPPY
jgi:hypothetical protein